MNQKQVVRGLSPPIKWPVIPLIFSCIDAFQFPRKRPSISCGKPILYYPKETKREIRNWQKGTTQ